MSRNPGSTARLSLWLPVTKTIPALTTVFGIAARVTAREAVAGSSSPAYALPGRAGGDSFGMAARSPLRVAR